jgi:Glycine/D-amino acid oxidases (deaminating)
VILLERRDLSSGVTGQSPGVVRCYYQDPALTELAFACVQHFREWATKIGPECGLYETGVITALREDEELGAREIIAKQLHVGTGMLLLGTEDMSSLYDDFNPNGLAGAVYEPQAGYCDTRAVTRGLARAAAQYGAQILLNSSVKAIHVFRDRVQGVETTEGRVNCGTVINAAGAWAPILAETCNAPLPIQLQKHEVVEVFLADEGPTQLPPYMEACSSFYLGPLGANKYVVGPAGKPAGPAMLSEVAEARSGVTLNLPYAQYVSRRFTRFTSAKIVGGRSAPFDNTQDRLPLVGSDPRFEGLFVAAGLSGHGFKFCPLLGMAMAELVLTGKTNRLVKQFDPARFLS